jgi:hypothetical protein
MKLLRVLFCLIVITGLLAGCKKPPEATPTPVPTATEPAVPAPPTATPVPGEPYPVLPTPTSGPATLYPVLPTPVPAPATPYPSE